MEFLAYCFFRLSSVLSRSLRWLRSKASLESVSYGRLTSYGGDALSRANAAVAKPIMRSRLVRPIVDWHHAPPPLTIKVVLISAAVFLGAWFVAMWIGGKFREAEISGEFKARSELLRSENEARNRARLAEMEVELERARTSERLARAELARALEEAEKAALGEVEKSPDGVWSPKAIKELNR